MERPAGWTIRARDEAEYAITAAKRCFELEDRLQALRPGAGDPSRGVRSASNAKPVARVAVCAAHRDDANLCALTVVRCQVKASTSRQ